MHFSLKVGISAKSMIFDEPTHTHIPAMRNLIAGFYWFITATPDLLSCYNFRVPSSPTTASAVAPLPFPFLLIISTLGGLLGKYPRPASVIIILIILILILIPAVRLLVLLFRKLL